MTLSSKNFALLPIFACAALVSAQQPQPAPDKPAATPAPERPRRRAGFISGIDTGQTTARPDSFRFSIEQAVAKAIEANRDLRAASFLVEEAQGRRDGAGLLSNPELELGGGPGLYGRDTALIQAAIRQKFPLTSRLSLEEKYADAGLAAAKEEVLIARRALVGAVKNTAVRLIAAREEITLLRRRQDIAKDLATGARTRAERGESSRTEAGFLDLESADLADTIARAEADRASLLVDFRVKLGLRPDADADVTGALPDSRDNFGLPDPAACPECRKMTILADASQTAVELEQAKKWQDISVGVFGQMEHTNDTSTIRVHQTISYAGVQVSVPLPLWNDNSGAIRSALAKRERLRDELSAEILRLDGEAQSARREFDNLAARLPVLRDSLVPAARAQTDLVKTSVARGESIPADLYRALDKQVSLELRELILRRDIALSLVRLETALSAHPSLKDPVSTPAVPE